MKKEQHNNNWQDIIASGQQGFEAFFLSNYSTFFTLAYRMCGDQEMSKDLIQSFFLEIWEKRYRMRDINNPQAYLRTAFRNKVLAELKRQQQSGKEKLEALPHLSTPSYEELLIGLQEDKSRREQLRRAIDQLPTEQRKILEFRYLSELSYDEIASRTGKSRQTIYNQIHAAIKKLKGFLR